MLLPERLNAWAEWWGTYMWNSTIDSAVGLGIAGMLWMAGRKRLSVQAGYVLFLLVFVKLIFPGFVSLPGLIHSWVPASFEIPAVLGDNGIGWGSGLFSGGGKKSPAGDNNPVSLPSMDKPRLPALSKTFWLMAVWAVLVLLLLLRFAKHQWSVGHGLHHTQPVKKKALRTELDELARRSGLRRPVVWLTAGWLGSPVVWGLTRPRIILPQDFEKSFTRTQRQWILLHELAHIRRGDIWVRLIQSLFQIAFFFNPVVAWSTGRSTGCGSMPAMTRRSWFPAHPGRSAARDSYWSPRRPKPGQPSFLIPWVCPRERVSSRNAFYAFWILGAYWSVVVLGNPAPSCPPSPPCCCRSAGPSPTCPEINGHGSRRRKVPCSGRDMPWCMTRTGERS